MRLGYWTTVKKSKNYKALQDCVSIREYAAVCWGGHTTSSSTYPATWSVLLRDRLREGDPHLPATCHEKIPDLIYWKIETWGNSSGFQTNSLWWSCLQR